jgi:hypothetical protein
MSWRSSPIVGMVFLAIVAVAGTGLQRESYDALNGSNLTTNQTDTFEALTGSLVELLPILVLALAGVFVVRAALDLG